MSIKIALAGNPNSGKTTLFNALTGSNQFVGNWPGVTVEKKEGKLKNRDDVIIVDLPGVYSLSPYSLEEVVARNFLVNERPDAILNIVDGTNIERNLYLTTQLIDLGIPTVVAINMADVVRKKGDVINFGELSRVLGCRVVEISALKEEGIAEAAEAAIEAAGQARPVPLHIFSGAVEHALAHIEEATVHGLPAEQQRWYAIKIFERDSKVLQELNIPAETLAHIEQDIVATERELDDDAESIIINDRYNCISNIISKCIKRKNYGKLSTSDKIDRVVTNRFLALPIFAVIMFLVYYISVSTVGTWVTDWTNDGLFGDGFHLFGIGNGEYEESLASYGDEFLFTPEIEKIIDHGAESEKLGAEELKAAFESKDFFTFKEAYDTYGENFKCDCIEYDLTRVSHIFDAAPSPSEYGVWVPGVPVWFDSFLLNENGEPVVAEWLYSLIQDGIISGVGAVLGFVPQMIVLFIFLAFLEACGYMARIAFVMDRVFRNFGLSGKSFIPMLIGTGCGVPGIMSSRTIENERDRRMTIITTTFIPCSAKLPVIALISTALFGGAWWVAPSAYFLGIAAIIISGIMLKKTKLFSGDVAPFVMELPAYHMPTFGNVMRSMWERISSFIKKAGTVILLSTIIIWLGSKLGFVNNAFAFSIEMELENSLLGIFGKAVAWIFTPLGFGNIKACVATLMGLVAKEEIVGVFGVLDFEGMGALAGYSFLAFNLLCAPCFAAIGAIRREMNSTKWTMFAILYQCIFAYAVSLIIFQIGSAFAGALNAFGLAAAIIALAVIVFMLVKKPYKAK